MNWLIQGLLTNFIWAAVVLAAGATLGLLKLGGSDLFLPAAWSLVGTALGAVVFAGWHVATLRPDEPSVTPTNVETKVREWADAFGLGVQRVDLPDARFALRITLKNERSVFVFQQETLPKYLIVQSVVTLADEHRKQYESMVEQKRFAAIEHLLLETSRAGRDTTVEIDLPKKLFLVHDTQRLPITSRLDEHEFISAVDRAAIGWLLMRNAVVQSLKLQSD